MKVTTLNNFSHLTTQILQFIAQILLEQRLQYLANVIKTTYCANNEGGLQHYQLASTLAKPALVGLQINSISSKSESF